MKGARQIANKGTKEGSLTLGFLKAPTAHVRLGTPGRGRGGRFEGRGIFRKVRKGTLVSTLHFHLFWDPLNIGRVWDGKKKGRICRGRKD